jgi:sirohydrochlorin ferrochelatase
VLGLETARDARTVFVTEGEPDWLATLDALAGQGATDAGAVGLCAVSQGWRSTWSRWLATADRVVVMVHRGRGETCTADRIAGQVADSLAELRDTHPRALLEGGAVVRVPVPDDDDLADHHQRGELAHSIVRHL